MNDISINRTAATDTPLLNDVGRSPQMAFALLQMELAKSNKENALSGIKEIENQQAQKKNMAEFLNTARDMQSKGMQGSATQEEYSHLIDVAKDYRDRGWASVPDIDNALSKFGMQGPPRGSVSAAVQKWAR